MAAGISSSQLAGCHARSGRIEPAKFDAAWRLGDQWVGPGGVPGGHGERYPKAGKWILSGNPTDMCQIWIGEEGVGFIDGRHRFAWLRDQGVLAIPVQLSLESLERGIGPFATVMRTSMLLMSTNQDHA